MKTIRQNFPTNFQPTPATTTWLYGTIHAVEPAREMLFLHQPQDDHDQIIHWRPQTRFLYHGEEVKPDALHDGQQVSVRFATDHGQMFAKEIDIVVEPPVAASNVIERRSLRPSRSGKKARQ